MTKRSPPPTYTQRLMFSLWSVLCILLFIYRYNPSVFLIQSKGHNVWVLFYSPSAGSNNQKSWRFLVKKCLGISAKLRTLIFCEVFRDFMHKKYGVRVWKEVLITIMPKHKSLIFMYMLRWCSQHHCMAYLCRVWSGSCVSQHLSLPAPRHRCVTHGMN